MSKEPVDLMPIDHDTPLRLEEAARIVFRGKLGVSGLRREIARGNLQVERIAGRLWVTLRAIEEMRERCREHACPPACGSYRPQRTEKPYGSSSTVDVSTALAAARLSAQRLRQGLQPTSERKRPAAGS